MVDVVGDDGAAPGDFVADEFGGDSAGEFCAPVDAGVLDAEFGFGLFAFLVFADGDVFHFGGDDAFAGVVHLADAVAGFGAARIAGALESQRLEGGVVFAFLAVGGGDAVELVGVGAVDDPFVAEGG